MFKIFNLNKTYGNRTYVMFDIRVIMCLSTKCELLSGFLVMYV